MPGACESTSDRLHREWVEKLHRIINEVYAVHHYRQLWRSLAEITQAANLPPSVFFDALGVWYAATQGIAVRRQLDNSRGVVSLKRLLEEVALHPEVMTRERHVALWTADHAGPEAAYFEAQGNRNFDRFSGGGDRIPRDRVRADIAELETTGEIVKHHVDAAIAHTALAPTTSVPTYGELNAAIDVVASLVKKYASLLEAVILWQFEPAIQHDWTAIFRTPWIPARP